MIDPRLLNHPKVREEAERLAVEAWMVTKPSAPPTIESRAGTADSSPRWWIKGFCLLLSDPTRPETISFFAHDLIEDYWRGKHGIEPIQIRVRQNERTRSADERIVSEWLAVNQ